jgi:hypothetical protein
MICTALKVPVPIPTPMFACGGKRFKEMAVLSTSATFTSGGRLSAGSAWRDVGDSVESTTILTPVLRLAAIGASPLPNSQNGAKQGSTNLPAEICLKSTRLRVTGDS